MRNSGSWLSITTPSLEAGGVVRVTIYGDVAARSPLPARGCGVHTSQITLRYF
jgi:hypothetical protein